MLAYICYTAIEQDKRQRVFKGKVFANWNIHIKVYLDREVVLYKTLSGQL